MLKHRSITLLLAIMMAGWLAACDESSEILNAPGTEGAELDLAVDTDLTEALLADARAALDAVDAAVPTGPGDVTDQLVTPNVDNLDAARALLEQAREKFIEANRAWRHGDTELAAQLALEARLLIAQALVLVFGEDAYNDLLMRVDNIIAWLEEEVDGQASELLSRIRELRDEAVAIREEDPDSEDNLIRATERLLLALQIAHRERVQHRHQEMAQHARHSIFMASVAIDLALDIVGDDPNERQGYALRHAAFLRNNAVQKFEAGRFSLAFALARESVNLSLVAVLLEPGSDVDKISYMVGVSDAAIAAAQEVITSFDAAGFLPRLLQHAQMLQDHALEIANREPRKAVHLLWHSSITAWAVVLMAEEMGPGGGPGPGGQQP
jgi:HEPN domain-containing protein